MIPNSAAARVLGAVIPNTLPIATAASIVVGAFVLALVLTWPLIGWLRAQQFGKTIRVDGPDHSSKTGTPTMGGLGLLAAVAASGVATIAASVATDTGMTTVKAADVILPALGAMAGFALLGLVDDLAGLSRRQGREVGVGLTARRMFALQTVGALSVAMFVSSQHPWPPWMPALFALAILGTANGVNFSDGLDGLAAGLAAIAFAALGLMDLLRTDAARGVPAGAVMCFAVAAACLGFLVYNRHPARVFMGNVTSMALGAGLATLAITMGFIWFLPIVGAVFVVEVVSDIVQVVFFKATGGRRFFRMAPIHHHFELGGWPETTVVRRFWLAGLVAGAAGLALVLI